MDQHITALEGCTREVRITLSATDLKPHYNDAYAKAQKSISLPGFRKGKVPLPTIKQRFGKQIEAEALESIADTEFKRVALAEKLPVVGNPALTNIEESAEGGVVFTILCEVMPDFDLGDYRSLSVNRPVRPVSENDVQEEIDRLCLRAATFETAEESTDAMHVVTFTMDGKEERVFLDDDQVDMHLRNSLTNKKVGDATQYTAETQDENSEPPTYEITITDIQKVVPAEFTNSFVETITGGRFTTTEDLRNDIETQLHDYFQRTSRNAVENQIVEQLVNMHSFDIPHSLVHSVMHQLFEDFKKRNEGAPGIEQLTAHDLEDELKPSAERIVRWELIRNKIVDAEKLEIADEDLGDAAEKYGIPEDQFRMLMRQNQQVMDQLLAEKTMTALIEYAVVTDVDADTQQPIV